MCVATALSRGLRVLLAGSLAALSLVVVSHSATAQYAPTLGYMHPAGVAAGTSTEVTLGGYDWTPDMQVFAHDPRIRIELVGAPGPVTIPEPPFWFGKKARRAPFPIPREFKAKLTVSADVPPGVVRWQAANANGVTNVGKFVVSNGPEAVEIPRRKQPQALETLPVTVSGQVKITEEVDRYRFRVAKPGLVTCVLTSRQFDSPVNAVLEIRDDAGRMVADVADTSGDDIALTFLAEAGHDYTAEIYDLDFRGDRAFTYRLLVTPGPRVVAAIPAAGKRGETREVEFVGYGILSGKPQLESLKKPVAFPADVGATSFRYALETPHGVAPPHSLGLSDLTEAVEPASVDLAARALVVPGAVTGTLDSVNYGEDVYRVTGKKGDAWTISLQASRFNSPLDVALAILDATGKELLRSDDVPGTTDVELDFAVPADGDYQLVVSDNSGRFGDRAGVYRLVVAPGEPGFKLSIPEILAVPIGAKGNLALKVVRTGGFKEPININVAGLPAGVTAPAMLTVPMGQAALNIELTVAADAAAAASMLTVTGEAMVGDKPMKRATEQPTVMALTLKAPFTLDAEGLDDVTKWPRGSTFPGPVNIERDAGFTADIVLEMHSRQGRVIQGIWGPEMTIKPDVKRALYPIFLPEWLETTRTSRMVVNGVAKIPDPKGNMRYSLQKLKTRIGFLPGGALMKIATSTAEVPAVPGATLTVPLTISRTNDLKEDVTLELLADEDAAPHFTGAKRTLTAEKTTAEFPIQIAPTAPATGEYELTIRATLLQRGQYAVVSETKVLVLMGAGK